MASLTWWSTYHYCFLWYASYTMHHSIFILLRRIRCSSALFCPIAYFGGDELMRGWDGMGWVGGLCQRWRKDYIAELSRGQAAICIHIFVLVFGILHLCWDRAFAYLNLWLCISVCVYLSFCDVCDDCILHSKLVYLQTNKLTSRETVPLESLSNILNAPSTKKFWREQNKSYVVQCTSTQYKAWHDAHVLWGDNLFELLQSELLLARSKILTKHLRIDMLMMMVTLWSSWRGIFKIMDIRFNQRWQKLAVLNFKSSPHPPLQLKREKGGSPFPARWCYLLWVLQCSW